jgi:uncharacterized membrane protein
MAPAIDSASADGLRLLDLPPPWVIVFGVLPAVFLLAWMAYGRGGEGLALSWRLALGGLRALAVLLLLAVLARPVREQRREDVRPAEVLVLIDDSASMQRRDAYAADEPARAALEAATGLDPRQATRSELARAALARELLPALAARDYRVSLAAFDEHARSLAGEADLASLAAEGRGTHLGDSLAQALSGMVGRHLTDVVVISDGRSTGGSTPLEVAALVAGVAAAEASADARAPDGGPLGATPVHTLLVGDPRPDRNSALELVELPAQALAGDEISVVVRAASSGIAPGSPATLVLEEASAESSGGDAGAPASGPEWSAARAVDTREIELSPEGTRVVLVAPGGGADGSNAAEGTRHLRVVLTPQDGEALTDDNLLELAVPVSRQKVRVLLVDGLPRYEYRFLVHDLLKRSDENIEFQAWLGSASPDFPQECSRDLEPLRELPSTRQELLDRYDVVILGDVDPYALGRDPGRAEAFWEALREFVAAGGGLLVQAGTHFTPRAWLGTPLEELLPVVVDSALGATARGVTSEFRPTLEDPLDPHAIARLAPDLEVNRRLWEDQDGLRGFLWYYPVPRAKPGAQVLARHPVEGDADGRYPLITAGYWPAGRTLFIAVDGIHRWLNHYGSRYYERFWRGAIRWLALGRLHGGDPRWRLESPRSSYALDEVVSLEARVLDDDWKPSGDASQSIELAGPDGARRALELAASPGRPGVFQGSTALDRTGQWQARAERDGKLAASASFEVALPARESADPSPDPEALAALAERTGGRALALGQARQLLAELPGGEELRRPIAARLEDAWDRGWTLALAVLLLGAEWLLRKRQDLA